MTDWDRCSETELAAAWDVARRSVLRSPVADLSLRDFAEEIGKTWRYVHADEKVRTLLVLTWAEIGNLRGLGPVKTGLLLDYVTAAAARWAEGGQEGLSFQAETTGVDTGTALACLGVARATPVELLRVSGRARTFLRRAMLEDVGSLLDFLEGSNQHALQRHAGVGSKTARELLGILSAVSRGRVDLVRQYLPLRVFGCGLCFSAAAAGILGAAADDDREALSRHVVHGDTLQEAAQYSGGRTRARVAQIIERFLEGFKAALDYFPDEKNNLWEAWQRCAPLEELLNEDLDAAGRRTVAAVLSRIFGASTEGRAVNAYRKSVFDGWWKEVRCAADFYLGGLRVARFVRERGEPRLLVPFLDYLEDSGRAEVCRTSGRVLSKRRPLKRVVKAILDSSCGPLTVPDLLSRLQAWGLSCGLSVKVLEGRLKHWVRAGAVPEDKVV